MILNFISNVSGTRAVTKKFLYNKMKRKKGLSVNYYKNRVNEAVEDRDELLFIWRHRK